MPGVSPSQVKTVRLLATGSELKIFHHWTTERYPDHTFVMFGPDPITVDPALPDPIDTVVEVTLK